MPAIPLPSNASVIKRVVGADPAANNEFLLTVPAGKFWWLQTVCVPLVQGATQTPQPILIIDDGAVSIFQGFGSSAAQAVSTTCTYTWGAGLLLTAQIGATTNVNAQGALADDLVLPPGYRIRSLTLGLGANSDYGVPSALVVELG